MTSTHAFWLAGRRVTGEDTFDVTSPWDGRLVGRVAVPDDQQIEEAVAAAYAVRDEFAATPAHVRAAALDHVSRRLVERTEEIAQLISAENGKPIKWARGRSAVPSPCSGSPRRRPGGSTAVRPSASTPTWAVRGASR